ncbi:MAG: hypothetical protein JKY08_10320 [Flavobacteriaceae bacterium]|nr:hypothetical protein [Flavobacteriaceae bacterium]
MRPLNYKEVKKQKIRFILVYIITLIIVFCSSCFTIITASKGVTVLEDKYAGYNKIFEDQAGITFDLDEIIKKLHQIKGGKRTLSEHKQFQLLISKLRISIEKIIKESDAKPDTFLLYEEVLVEIKTIQSVIDRFGIAEEEYLQDKEMYERCIQRYRDLNRN